mmetsp:Transcript_554/g.1303  ORF Transcript_554/g.1303 Transcript_554/m.1303 type:complete len:83 (-) Transcript_554:222-470(-)
MQHIYMLLKELFSRGFNSRLLNITLTHFSFQNRCLSAELTYSSTERSTNPSLWTPVQCPFVRPRVLVYSLRQMSRKLDFPVV